MHGAIGCEATKTTNNRRFLLRGDAHDILFTIEEEFRDLGDDVDSPLHLREL